MTPGGLWGVGLIWTICFSSGQGKELQAKLKINWGEKTHPIELHPSSYFSFPSILPVLLVPLWSPFFFADSFFESSSTRRDCSHYMAALQSVYFMFQSSLLLISVAISQCVNQCPEMTHHVFTEVIALQGRVRNWKFHVTGKTNVLPA